MGEGSLDRYITRDYPRSAHRDCIAQNKDCRYIERLPSPTPISDRHHQYSSTLLTDSPETYSEPSPTQNHRRMRPKNVQMKHMSCSAHLDHILPNNRPPAHPTRPQRLPQTSSPSSPVPYQAPISAARTGVFVLSISAPILPNSPLAHEVQPSLLRALHRVVERSAGRVAR